MRKPKIGDIVIYQRHGSKDDIYISHPTPAIVTQLLSTPENGCHLFVMNPNGIYFNPTPYSEKLKPGHWSWPEEEKQEIKLCIECHALPVYASYENKFCSIDCAVTYEHREKQSVTDCNQVKECEHEYIFEKESFGRSAHFYQFRCTECNYIPRDESCANILVRVKGVILTKTEEKQKYEVGAYVGKFMQNSLHICPEEKSKECEPPLKDRKEFSDGTIPFWPGIDDKKPRNKAEELIGDAQKQINDFYKKLNETKEDIIKAFIAKYGYQPDEIVLHEQTTEYGKQYWVDKKKDPDNTAEELIEKIWSLLIEILANEPVHGHEWGTSNNLIYKWIEEYKANK
jgi:hypothetical protein